MDRTLQFAAHGEEIAFGIGGQVKHVNQHSRAREMAQKADAQAVAEMSTLDKARDIGDAEPGAVGKLDAAEIGRERGERIGRDFRMRRADGGEQRGFAGVGQTDQAGVGH